MKPSNYDSLNKGEKLALMAIMFEGDETRGMFLLNEAFRIAGKEKPPVTSPGFNQELARCLEMAIRKLGSQSNSDPSTLHDIEIILEGMRLGGWLD